jgi:hypothetical protein
LVYKWADPETRSLVDAAMTALENCDRKLTEAEARAASQERYNMDFETPDEVTASQEWPQPDHEGYIDEFGDQRQAIEREAAAPAATEALTARFIPGRSCRHGINPDECEFCDSPGADKEEATRQALRRTKSDRDVAISTIEENRRLRLALHRYGRHDDSCGEWPDQNQLCDCGFADARDAAFGERP